MRKRVRREDIPPPQLRRTQSPLAGEPVDHPLALEVEVAARVAAVRPREALVGHDDGSVDFQILKAIRTDKITGRAKTTSRFGAPDVATDIIKPAEAHPEDRPILLRGELAVGDAVGAARGGEQVLATVFDPLDRDAAEQIGRASCRERV